MKRIGCVWAIAILSSVGCVGLSVDLEPVGEKIALQTTLKPEQNTTHEKAKFIQCDLGANGRSSTTNDRSCANFLRNEAGRIGAEFVVLEQRNDDGSSDFYGKLCNNCMTTAGWAYRKKPPNAKVTGKPDGETADDASDDLAATDAGGVAAGADGLDGESEEAAPKAKTRTRYKDPEEPAQLSESRPAKPLKRKPASKDSANDTK